MRCGSMVVSSWLLSVARARRASVQWNGTEERLTTETASVDRDLLVVDHLRIAAGVGTDQLLELGRRGARRDRAELEQLGLHVVGGEHLAHVGRDLLDHV